MVAGEDNQPQDGFAPTHLWQKNKLVADPHILPITLDIPASDNYRLEVGLYYLPTSERLEISDASGQVGQDSLMIEPFSVVE
jgi:hypothetical protein